MIFKECQHGDGGVYFVPCSLWDLCTPLSGFIYFPNPQLVTAECRPSLELFLI